MPTPRPEIAVTSLAVESPASKISASCSRCVSCAASAFSITPLATAFSTSLLPSMPRPSSWISIRI
jgi:hypothetical protein